MPYNKPAASVIAGQWLATSVLSAREVPSKLASVPQVGQSVANHPQGMFKAIESRLGWVTRLHEGIVRAGLINGPTRLIAWAFTPVRLPWNDAGVST